MDDMEARFLLQLLHKYVKAYAPDIPQTILALAEDLVQSTSEPYDRGSEELLDEIRDTPGVQ